MTRRAGIVAIAATGVVALVPAAASAAMKLEEKRVMNSSPNIDMVCAIMERGFNQGDLSFIDAMAADRIAEHEYLAPSNMSGAAAIRGAITETRKAVRQLHLTIEDIIEGDGKVWTRCHATGVEATTGKAFTMYVFDTFRFENGKLVEHWGVPDRFAMLHQVGLLPSTAA